MKKALLIFSLLFNVCLFSKAQFKQIAASPEFNEPYSGSSKFLLLKNGNLVFADVGFRDSIRIRVYNAAHQEIAVISNAMRSPVKRTYLGLRAAFEIDSNVILFIIAEEEKAEVFYRVIVDPNSGKVKKEEKILGLKSLRKDESYALWRGNWSISKGVDNDSYAIAYCNNFRSDKIKKIEVVLFDKEHFEIGRAYYETAEKEFEAMTFRGIAVADAEKTGLLFTGSPWKDGGVKVFLAIMKKGSSNLSITELNLSEDKIPADPKLYYNQYSKKFIVAIVCGGKKANKYLLFLDPETGKTEKTISYDFSDAFYEKSKDIYGKKYVFYGQPINFLAEKNGSFSVVYEADGDLTTMGYSGLSSHQFASDIIIADFDKNSKLLSNYMVPRKVFLNPSSSMNYGGGFGNNYTDFAYIKNNGNAYLFLNDFRENIERLQKNKDPKQVVVVHDCDAFYFPLTGNEPMPPRKYLYGETDEKEGHIQSPFGVFAYDKENDIFITLRLKRDEKKRTKTVNVVWLKPQ